MLDAANPLLVSRSMSKGLMRDIVGCRLIVVFDPKEGGEDDSYSSEKVLSDPGIGGRRE